MNNDFEASEPWGEGVVDWNAVVIFDVIGDNDDIDGGGNLSPSLFFWKLDAKWAQRAEHFHWE